MTDIKPFEEMAHRYAEAGWTGVVPLNGKYPAVAKLTGHSGVDADDALRSELVFHYPAHNIGLRLPVGVVGVDIDDYGNKVGATTMARLVEKVGSRLPSTWSSTSRGAGHSRILFYRARLPRGRRWRNQEDIEIIHRGHRHAVVWPSVHPEHGGTYRWYRPDGTAAEDDQFPHIIDLAELPERWITALTVDDSPEVAGATQNWLHGARDGTPCGVVTERWRKAITAIGQPDANKHEIIRDGQLALLGMAAEGHRGVVDCLTELRAVFLNLAPGREGEWSRALDGGVRQIMLTHDAPKRSCICEGSDRLQEMIEALLKKQQEQRDTLSLFVDPSPVDDDGELVVDEEERAGVDPDTVPPVELITTEGDLAGGPMAREFKTLAAIDTEPDPQPLIRGLLYRDSLAWLVAPSGSFKSFLALSLGLAVAEGTPWFGRPVSGPSTVLYLYLEGKLGLKRRKRAWEKHHGRRVPSNLLVRTEPLDVRSDDAMANLALFVAESKPALVILDTQAKVALGYEENSNSEMSDFIQRVDHLRRVSGACILLVHHEGKAGAGLRGASAIHGAADTVLQAERAGKDSLDVTLGVLKQKDGDEDEKQALTMLRVPLDPDAWGNPVDSLVPVPCLTDPKKARENEVAEYREVIYGYVRNAVPRGGATKGEARSAAGAAGFRDRRMFDSAWDELVNPKPDDETYVPPLAKVAGGRNYVARAVYEGANYAAPAADDEES